MTNKSGIRNWALLGSGVLLVAVGGAVHFAGSEVAEPGPVPVAVQAEPAGAFPAADPSLPTVKVWKSPTCGCCGAWVDHMRHAGFAVEVEDLADLTHVKHEHGIHAGLQSCHTAFVDGYALEGHVPAEDVLRLLEEQPYVKGLAVPGMPVGSPGMEMGDRRDRYDVLTFDASGRTTVWATHP